MGNIQLSVYCEYCFRINWPKYEDEASRTNLLKKALTGFEVNGIKRDADDSDYISASQTKCNVEIDKNLQKIKPKLYNCSLLSIIPYVRGKGDDYTKATREYLFMKNKYLFYKLHYK